VDKRLAWPDPKSASLDHVRPISRGGSHTYFNVQLAHLTCNLKKGKGAA
jgi:5-methylcytosine-specific restriction endonuclease McrA